MAEFCSSLMDELEKINAKIRDDFLKFDERCNEDLARLRKIAAEGLALIHKKSGNAFNAENIGNESLGKEEVGNKILASTEVEVSVMDTDSLVLPTSDLITNSQSTTTIDNETVTIISLPTVSTDDVDADADQVVKQKKLSCGKRTSRGTYRLLCLSKGLHGRRSSLMRIALGPNTRLSSQAIIDNIVGNCDSPAVTGIRTSDMYYTCKTKLSSRFKIDEMEATVEDSSDKPDSGGERVEELSEVFNAVDTLSCKLNNDEICDAVDASKNVVIPQPLSPPFYRGARPKVRNAKSKNASDSSLGSTSLKNRAMPIATSNSAPSRKYFREAKQKTISRSNSARMRCISVTSNTPRRLTPAEKKTKLEEKSRKNKAAQDMLEAELNQKLEEKRRRREERMRKAQEARLQKEQEIAKKYESEELMRAMIRNKNGSKRPLLKMAPAQVLDVEKYGNFMKKKLRQHFERKQKLAESMKLENESVVPEKPVKSVNDEPITSLQNETFDVEKLAEVSNGVPETSVYDITMSKPESKYVRSQADADDYGIQYLHSDDSTDEESKPKKKIPSWASGAAFERLLLIQVNSNMNIEKLFPPSVLLVLPDLEQIFDYTHPKLRHRTSSAHWSSPPCHGVQDVIKSLDT